MSDISPSSEQTDYRCNDGHPFSVPWGDEAPRSTVVCPECGATSFIEIVGCAHIDDPTHDGVWCGYCNPTLGGDGGRSK